MTLPAPLIDAAEADLRALLEPYPYTLDQLRDMRSRTRLESALLRKCIYALYDQMVDLGDEVVRAYSHEQIGAVLNRSRWSVIAALRKRDA